MSKVDQLAGEITKMSPAAAGELGAALARALGIRLPVAPAPLPVLEKAPEAVQTEFTLTLLGLLEPGKKIALIKAVREIKKDLGMIEAKNFVELAPQVIGEGYTREDADKLAQKLTEAGGNVGLS